MKNLAKSFLSYLLLLISFTTVAQVEYLKKDAQLESELSIKQKDQYAKLKNLKSFKSVDIVKVSSLKDLQKNGELKFSLPNYDKKLVAKALYVDAKDSENYKWHGEIFDKKDDLIGFMHIVVEDGNTSGLINTGGQEFHLVSFEDNKKGASFLLESISVLVKFIMI
jgi:hypothetical protein